MCAPRVASWCSCTFSFCQDHELIAGLTPVSSESPWRKGGDLLHYSTSMSFLRADSTSPRAQLSTFLTVCVKAGWQFMRRFGSVQVSEPHRQLRSTAKNSSNWGIVFSQALHDCQAVSLMRTLRLGLRGLNLPLDPRAISACCAPANATAPGSCWRAARQKSIF